MNGARRHGSYAHLHMTVGVLLLIGGLFVVTITLLGGVFSMAAGAFLATCAIKRYQPRTVAREYATVFILVILSVALFGIGYGLSPDVGNPKEPEPPSVTFVAGTHENVVEGLKVRLVVWLAQWSPLSHEGVSYDCALFKFEGNAAEARQDWAVRVTPWSGDYVIGTGPDLRHLTTMRYPMQGPPPVRSPEFEPESPLAPASNQISLCWPSARHLIVATHGSSSAISMPGLRVKKHGGSAADLQGGTVSVVAALSRCDGCDVDWAMDSGKAPDSQGGRTPWSWNYSFRVNEVTYFDSVRIRVHGIGEAAEERHLEFLSGVYYGVGAATLVATAQEFFNRVSRSPRRRGTPGTRNADAAAEPERGPEG
ncbi:hypothetical protein GCM10010206_08960 [Streptomyces cinerochromogenes]|nr:hypothetical protein GCM10010206_08960 [Streptomyces cinerochromogenes]